MVARRLRGVPDAAVEPLRAACTRSAVPVVVWRLASCCCVSGRRGVPVLEPHERGAVALWLAHGAACELFELACLCLRCAQVCASASAARVQFLLTVSLLVCALLHAACCAASRLFRWHIQRCQRCATEGLPSARRGGCCRDFESLEAFSFGLRSALLASKVRAWSVRCCSCSRG